MGCQGSKTAQASKPEEPQAVGATLLQDPVAEVKTVKPEELKTDTPTAESSDVEACRDGPAVEGPGVVSPAGATMQKGTGDDIAALVIAPKSAEVEAASADMPDATAEKATETLGDAPAAHVTATDPISLEDEELVASESQDPVVAMLPVSEEAGADAQNALLEVAVVPESVSDESLVVAGNAVVQTNEVPIVATSAIVAGSWAGCLQYCCATEAQSEFVVHKD